MTTPGPVPDSPKPAAAPSLAPHYERLMIDRQLKAGRMLAAVMGLGRGMRVLELGCGTGMLAEHLADRVGGTGEVLGLDPMPLRVQIAHQRGRHNLRFQVGQPGQLARFPAGCFDAIVANGVLHNWPEPGQALAECARLLAPGGRLGLVTHSAEHPHPAAQAQAAVLAEPAYAAHPLPDEARDHALGIADLRRLLRQAGFDDVRVEAQPDTTLHANATAAIEHRQASAWGRLLGHLPEPLRAIAHTEIALRLEALRGPEGIRHDGVRLVAVAARPMQPSTRIESSSPVGRGS